MEKCSLCKENDATKSNSHLISWALIKDALSDGAHKKRGNEITYSISQSETPEVFVGRSILPDRIKEILGSSFSEMENIENKDPLTRDFIFCPSCERAIGDIENSFISKVYKKIKSSSVNDLSQDKKGNKKFLLSKLETNLTRLLAYSIFFRTSIVKLNRYSLKPKIQENIRLLLLKSFRQNQKELESYLSTLSADEFRYPILVCYLETNTFEETGDNVVIQERSTVPYFVWANRIIFQLYEKKSHINSSVQHFFGLSQFVAPKDYLPNLLSSQMNVCMICNERRNKMVLNALGFMASLHMRNMKSLFNKVCKGLLGRPATENEKNLFGYHYSIISTEKIHKRAKDPFVAAVAATFKIKKIK